MNSGYTKLFSSIITSSIWCEDDQTRLVWITLLALADQDGVVDASVVGLAKVAGVSVEATEEALCKFSEPDRYSRSKESEGRRIEEIDGGWRLINHAKYRANRDPEDRKDYMRDYMRQRRSVNSVNSRKQSVNSVNSGKPPLAQAEAEAEASSTNVEEYISAIYAEYPKKVSKPQALRAIRKALKSTDPEFLLNKTKAYADARDCADPQFTPNPATWFNGERYNDDPRTWVSEAKTERTEPEFPSL